MTAADSYTGDVTVGGPPDTRELPGLTVTKIAVGAYDNNVYLLRSGDDAVLIDGASEPDRILSALGDARLTAILQTHGHPDHTQAIEALKKATGAPMLCHPDDIEMMPVPPDATIADDEVIRVGSVELRAVHLVGHTPGGLAFVYEGADAPHLFSGDSLFPGGAGRTLNPVDFASLMDGLEAKVFGQMPDETWVYPGHGKDTTLGHERPSIPEWRARGW